MKKLLLSVLFALLPFSSAFAGWDSNRDGIHGMRFKQQVGEQQRPRSATRARSTRSAPVRRRARSRDTADNQPRQTTRRTARRTASRSNRGSRGRGAGSGLASYYWQGKQTANGERFNPGGMTAAHRTLPFGTRVRVTNRNNGKSVVVRINDRGPFIAGRVIDLARGAAGVIAMQGAGVVPVSLEVLGRR